MNKELFGVFGSIETFERHRSVEAFDDVLAGTEITVGIRDPGLGTPGWSARYADERGICVVWGEAYVPGDETNAARWLLEQYDSEDDAAFDVLNGSYLAVVDPVDDDAFVATDPVRSRECFYTDESGARTFGTDAASVARTVDEPTVNRNAVLEYLHLGVTLGEKAAFEELSRLPIDSRLTQSGVESFERFVYQPHQFDYVDELATRLKRALERRSILPGRKGLLLSAGYDSRIFLPTIPDIDRCYTVGTPSAQEVTGARRVATQYGVDHVAFEPDEHYLLAKESKTRYGQGIKESLHIHHAGYTDEMNVDTMYHGLLCDTFFRGHFTAQDTIELFGTEVPRNRLDPDPNPVDSLLGKFGYDRESSEALSERIAFDEDPEPFVRDAIAEEFDAVGDRAVTTQNSLTCCGIANQPSIPFHNHLADNFFASFLAADIELVRWHLETPPAHRTTDTFLEACERLDPNLLHHRPPDRPHDVTLLNEAERFIRRKTPLLEPFESPWPDRRWIFDHYGLDRKLLPELEHVHGLPARHKLRLNDLNRWIGASTDDVDNARSWLHPRSVARDENGNDDRSTQPLPL
ncbi:hypothetical protein ACFQO4_11595 [Saliphagus sp. GCM10025334]